MICQITQLKNLVSKRDHTSNLSLMFRMFGTLSQGTTFHAHACKWFDMLKWFSAYTIAMEFLKKNLGCHNYSDQDNFL